MTARRTLTVSRAEACQLRRRRGALVLLTVLPLAFYAASAEDQEHAVLTGGIAMAFSLTGAAIFSTLASQAVDRRLILAGYRTAELMLGRLLVLEALGLLVASGFAAIMITGSGPPHPGLLAGGVALVALIAVPLGLVLGDLLRRQLEAVLMMVGIVGIQLSVSSTAAAGKLLPFWGPRRLLDASVGEQVATLEVALLGSAYGLALLALSLALAHRRLRTTQGRSAAGRIARDPRRPQAA